MKKKIPYINIDPKRSLIQIEGRSIMEDSHSFYKPILEGALHDYIANMPEQTKVQVNLEYFNTSSSKWLLRFFKQLTALKEAGKQVEVDWHYEDDDILDAGEEYSSLSKIEFNFIEVE